MRTQRARSDSPTEPNDISYRLSHGTWEALVSGGLLLDCGETTGSANLQTARTRAHAQLSGLLGVTPAELIARLRHERVQLPELTGVERQGLWFGLIVPDFGVDDPSEEGRRLREGFEFYRQNVPVEHAGRVLCEPSASSPGVDEGREQFTRALW